MNKMCSKEQVNHIVSKINVGLPSWPGGVEELRSRLASWVYGADPSEADSNPSGGQHQRKKMPHALRGRSTYGWGLCPCLQNDEPPEITYCVVDREGSLALQAVTPTHPMPPPDELEAAFAELLEELDLTAVNKAALMDLPSSKKWQLYCSRRSPPGQQTPASTTTTTAEEYVKALHDLAEAISSGGGPTCAPAARALALDLRTALRTRAHSFVLRYTRAAGLAALLAALDAARKRRDPHLAALLTCIKALMNNSTGRAHVLAHPTSIDTIAQSLDTEDIRTKIAALEILGAVCLVPGGHKKVLEAMINYQKHSCERTRFQSVINDLDRSTGAYRDDVNLKTAIMSFVNAVLNYGPGEESLEFRLHLRYEFLMLGIQPVIEKLRKHENETLDRHIDFFEMVRAEDEKELARKFDDAHVDTKSGSAMFDHLRKKLGHTEAYPHFLSLLQHLMLMPFEYRYSSQHWLLVDRLVQQVVLQQNHNSSQDNVSTVSTENGSTSTINKEIYNPDVTAIDIDVSSIVHLLAKEEELVAARNKVDALEKENVDMATDLAKKDQQIARALTEREELEERSARLTERLEREAAAHARAQDRARQLQHQLNQRQRSGSVDKNGDANIPDDAKVEAACQLPSSFAPPAPPPPPLLCAPPPCAPPPPAPTRPARATPRPPHALKSYNWSKLPESKLRGTIWQELDESKYYKSVDLTAIDRMFCAYQKNGTQNEGSVEDLRQLGTKPRNKVLSVIDGRRAQNCTILLSKLKMTDEEICSAILHMDAGEQLPIDMVEQLLKFTPSAEEAALLEEHQDELENMARADRFLLQISRLPHYRQRVKCLLFKKKFSSCSSEAATRARTVLRAARELTRSRRLRTLLEIVLALGNYMNKGARGNASGFRLSSLNKLVDTKSSVCRDTTLLHFLVDILESKFKDVLHLEDDLPHVRAASKVSLEQLDKEIVFLRTGLAEVHKELEYHAAAPNKDDCFPNVMREFHAHASCAFSQMEDTYQDMKSQLDSCAALFGEESAAPEELFGAVEQFVSQLNDARMASSAARSLNERRARHERELKKRTLERKQSSNTNKSQNNNVNSNGGDCNGHSDGSREGTLNNGQAKGEFDDLISALRTGDVFGDEMAKFKRSRKSSKSRGRDSPPRGLAREDSRERQA